MKDKSLKEFKNQLTLPEKRKYLLPRETDVEILSLCKELEKLDLSKEDRFLVEFIKTQLEKDWRTPLLEKLRELGKKYK